MSLISDFDKSVQPDVPPLPTLLIPQVQQTIPEVSPPPVAPPIPQPTPVAPAPSGLGSQFLDTSVVKPGGDIAPSELYSGQTDNFFQNIQDQLTPKPPVNNVVKALDQPEKDPYSGNLTRSSAGYLPYNDFNTDRNSGWLGDLGRFFAPTIGTLQVPANFAAGVGLDLTRGIGAGITALQGNNVDEYWRATESRSGMGYAADGALGAQVLNFGNFTTKEGNDGVSRYNPLGLLGEQEDAFKTGVPETAASGLIRKVPGIGGFVADRVAELSANPSLFAKGVVGTTLDIVLDPLNYASGAAPVAKKVIQSQKALPDVITQLPKAPKIPRVSVKEPVVTPPRISRQESASRGVNKGEILVKVEDPKIPVKVTNKKVSRPTVSAPDIKVQQPLVVRTVERAKVVPDVVPPKAPAFVLQPQLTVPELSKFLEKPPVNSVIDFEGIWFGTATRKLDDLSALAQRVPKADGTGFLVPPNSVATSFKELEKRVELYGGDNADSIRSVLAPSGVVIPPELVSAIRNNEPLNVATTSPRVDLPVQSAEVPVDLPPVSVPNSPIVDATPVVTPAPPKLEVSPLETGRPVSTYTQDAVTDFNVLSGADTTTVPTLQSRLAELRATAPEYKPVNLNTKKFANMVPVEARTFTLNGVEEAKGNVFKLINKAKKTETYYAEVNKKYYKLSSPTDTALTVGDEHPVGLATSLERHRTATTTPEMSQIETRLETIATTTQDEALHKVYSPDVTNPAANAEVDLALPDSMRGSSPEVLPAKQKYIDTERQFKEQSQIVTQLYDELEAAKVSYRNLQEAVGRMPPPKVEILDNPEGSRLFTASLERQQGFLGDAVYLTNNADLVYSQAKLGNLVQHEVNIPANARRLAMDTMVNRSLFTGVIRGTIDTTDRVAMKEFSTMVKSIPENLTFKEGLDRMLTLLLDYDVAEQRVILNDLREVLSENYDVVGNSVVLRPEILAKTPSSIESLPVVRPADSARSIPDFRAANPNLTRQQQDDMLYALANEGSVKLQPILDVAGVKDVAEGIPQLSGGNLYYIRILNRTVPVEDIVTPLEKTIHEFNVSSLTSSNAIQSALKVQAQLIEDAKTRLTNELTVAQKLMNETSQKSADLQEAVKKATAKKTARRDKKAERFNKERDEANAEIDPC